MAEWPKAFTSEAMVSTARAPTAAAPMPKAIAEASAVVTTSAEPKMLTALIVRSPTTDWTVLFSTEAVVVEVMWFSARATPAANATRPPLTAAAFTSTVTSMESCASMLTAPARARTSELLRTKASVRRVTLFSALAPAPAAAPPNPMAAATA